MNEASRNMFVQTINNVHLFGDLQGYRYRYGQNRTEGQTGETPNFA